MNHAFIRRICPLVILASCFLSTSWAQEGDLKPPLPVWPSDYETVTDRQPVFRVNGRYGAKRYKVELARDAEFHDPVVVTAVNETVPGGICPLLLMVYEGEPLTDGQYYWRVFCAGAAGPWTQPANYRTFFISGEDRDRVDVPTGLAHPRILIRKGEVQGFLERVKGAKNLSTGWAYQQNAAYSMIDCSPPTEEYARAGRGQHGNYSAAAVWYHRHLENVALVAYVTRDENLAKKGVQMVLTAAGYDRWLGPLFDDTKHFNPPWLSALETAMMTQAVAVGYDLLYEWLSDAERRMIREALVHKGIRSLVNDWADPVGSSRIPRHQTPTGNWDMVCSASAGVAALVILGEHPEAANWVRIVRNRVRGWLEDRGGDYFVDNPWVNGRPDPIPVIGPSEPNFGVDGGYKESHSYMNYAMRYVCFFSDALRRVTRENLFVHVPDNILDPVAWNTMSREEKGAVEAWLVDFGDCWNAARYSVLETALMKNKGDGLAAWHYRRTRSYPQLPAALLWDDGKAEEKPPAPTVPMAVFRTIGQAVMRSGWSPDDPMAAVKFHQNRGHHDIGTFYLFGAGGATIIDSGPAPYGGATYHKYSSRSHAHNVVLVDDRNQERTDGKMLCAVSTSKMSAASGELSRAYPDALESWTRDLVMLPGGMALIFDRMEGIGKHKYDLILHPETPFKLEDSGTIVVDPESPRAWVSVLSDGPFEASEKDGYYSTVERKYVRYDGMEKASDRTFVTVCRWKDGPNVSIKPAGPGRWRIDGGALSVRLGGAEDDAIKTDARVAAVWIDGEVTHAIVVDGTTLKLEGRELFNSTTAVNGAFEFGVPVRAHIWAHEKAKVFCAASEEIRHVFRNGNRDQAAPAEGGGIVEVVPGESHYEAGSRSEPMGRQPLPFRDLLKTTPVDAPAYRKGVRALTSSTWSSGLDAIDGDPNTPWVSLLDTPMPQWLEIRLPEAEAMSRIRFDTRPPAEGRVETWDGTAWVELGRFKTDPEEASAEITFDGIKTDRFRVVTEKLGGEHTAAVITSLRWDTGE